MSVDKIAEKYAKHLADELRIQYGGAVIGIANYVEHEGRTAFQCAIREAYDLGSRDEEKKK